MHTTNGHRAESKCQATPKWVAKLNDQVLPTPGRFVSESVLRVQGKVPEDHAILRDHNDPHDPVIPLGVELDLADGSEFYSLPKCELDPARQSCHGLAKHVLVVNDRPQTVVRLHQTGRSIRDLFRIPPDHNLFADLESPLDEAIADSDKIDLGNGNVFITRRHEGLMIKVNDQVFTDRQGVQPRMNGAQIAALVFQDVKAPKVKKIVGEAKEDIPLDKEIDIQRCDEFRVFRCDVNAGFQTSRLDREVDILRAGGAKVSIIEGRPSAVVYHAISVTRGSTDYVTDVLVLIPEAYPSGIPDNAFLPAGSPLLGMTVGAQQETVSIDGKSWVKKSVHPYMGGNGVHWDQMAHGFHTYYNEVLSWLHA